MKRRQFLISAAVGSVMTSMTAPLSSASAEERSRANDFDPTESSISQLQRQLSSGLTSAALVTAYLRRISALDQQGPTYRSIIAINPDALDNARRLDSERRDHRVRGPLHGIPVLVKDNIETSDRMPTTAGSLALANAFHTEDAPLVARLRAAGAIILGKTNLSEWANFRSTFSSSGWSAVGGQTGNAYDSKRNPSGSSSGSASAAALSFAAAAIGTETDGSILSPASVNGLVGFKPSIGTVSGHGVVPLSPRQDVAGPMARSVEDARLLADVIFDSPRRTPSGGSMRSGDWRVGVVPAASSMRAEVAALYEQAVDVWRRCASSTIDAPLPSSLRQAGQAEYTALLFEFKDSINAYLRALPAGLTETRSLESLIEFNRRLKDREMPFFGQEIFELAQTKGALSDPEYLECLRQLRQLVEIEGLEKLFGDLNVDVIVAPGSGPSGLIDHVLGDRDDLGGSILGSAAAVAGYPSVTLPIGLVRGMPVGMTVIARRFDDDRLLEAAALFERTGQLRVPPPAQPA
jgi:amidase